MWLTFIQYTSLSDVSSELNVLSHTVARYVKLFNVTGDVLPRAHRNGLLGEYEQLVLLRLILETPGIYLSQIQAKVFGVEISVSTICKTMG